METIEEILKTFKSNLLTQFPIRVDSTDDELLLNQMINDLELYILRYLSNRDKRIKEIKK